MALYTRAWENVVGILLTNPAEAGGSQGYLGVKDTAAGIGLTLLAPPPPLKYHQTLPFVCPRHRVWLKLQRSGLPPLDRKCLQYVWQCVLQRSTSTNRLYHVSGVLYIYAAA